MKSWQLPHGMRPTVPVTYVQCAACGVMGGLVLDGQPLLPVLDQVGAHIREQHPGENAVDALQRVRDVAHPPAGCDDVTAWVSEYNERAGRSL